MDLLEKLMDQHYRQFRKLKSQSTAKLLQFIMSQDQLRESADLHNHQYPSSFHSKPSQKTQNGKWSIDEHYKYIAYMEVHREQFKSKWRRRANKFYKQMASFIKTRNPLQCRSHHQKLEDRHSYANKIILAFKQECDQKVYEATLAQLRDFKRKQGPSVDGTKKQTSTAELQIQTEICGVRTQFLPAFGQPEVYYGQYQPHLGVQWGYFGSHSFFGSSLESPPTSATVYVAFPSGMNYF